jgi:hypothetical protein
LKNNFVETLTAIKNEPTKNQIKKFHSPVVVK